jgi:hypothetical protein
MPGRRRGTAAGSVGPREEERAAEIRKPVRRRPREEERAPPLVSMARGRRRGPSKKMRRTPEGGGEPPLPGPRPKGGEGRRTGYLLRRHPREEERAPPRFQ